MSEPVSLVGLEQHWGIRSKGCLINMPETGASMFRWSHANERGDFKFKPVRHNHYLLSLILRPMEAATWAGRQKVWDGPIGRHAVRIVHPEDENRWQCDSAFDLLHIMIPRQTIGRMLDPEFDQSSQVVRFHDPLYAPDEMILQIGRQMLNILEQEGPFVKDIADGLSHALIAYIMRRYVMGATQQISMPSRLQLRRALELVGDNLGREITLEEMAHAAGMSLFHFSREFRKAMGTSPHRYLMTCRIERAKELLANQKLSVLDVSLECGFKDPSHFSRVFRSLVGSTPRAYRQEI
jgi:AraC family transcriptional regulator